MDNFINYNQISAFIGEIDEEAFQDALSGYIKGLPGYVSMITGAFQFIEFNNEMFMDAHVVFRLLPDIISNDDTEDAKQGVIRGLTNEIAKELTSQGVLHSIK
jgi:hypothetical protein